MKSVAVVSLLDEKTQLHRGGPTVFNSKRAWTVDQSGELNRYATEHVESRLRAARPDWQFKDAAPYLAGLKAAQKAAGISWSSPTSSISKELAATASALDAERLFVIVDAKSEHLMGQGVGVDLLLDGLSSVDSVRVHATVVVALVDRNGNDIAARNAGVDSWVRRLAKPLGVDYEMAQIEDPQVQTKLKSIMREQLKAMLTLSATRLGY